MSDLVMVSSRRVTVAHVKVALSCLVDRFHTSQTGGPGCENTVNRKEKESGKPLPMILLQVYSEIFTVHFPVG